MPGKNNLLLFVSESMDANKKENRNEHGLVRMAAQTRRIMGFDDDSVELWNGCDDKSRINSSTILETFKAFTKDVTAAKQMVDEGKISKEDFQRVGFVTSRTYKRIVGNNHDAANINIWVSSGVEDTVIGADPEFLLFNGKQVQRANQTNGLSKNSLIGCDGAMAEVRPEPATTPEGLVNNIMRIFKSDRHAGPIREFKWYSGVYHKDDVRDYPIGGHIHIGNPAKIARIGLNDREHFFRVFNKILDEMLALPMMRLDGPNGNKRRTGCAMGNYGYFGEYRLCDGRLEHRTLSGIWLSHPKLAKVVFGVAKALIDEVYKRVANKNFSMAYMCHEDFRDRNPLHDGFDNWENIPLAKDLRCLRPSIEMRALLNKCSASVINKTFVTKWHKHMKSMSTYNKYAEYIDALAELLRRPAKELQGIDTCIKSNWLENKKFKLKL